ARELHLHSREDELLQSADAADLDRAPVSGSTDPDRSRPIAEDPERLVDDDRRVRPRPRQDHVVVVSGVDRRLDLRELGTAAGGADRQGAGGGERRDSDAGQGSEKEAMERHDLPMPVDAPGETGFSGFSRRRAWVPLSTRPGWTVVRREPSRQKDAAR